MLEVTIIGSHSHVNSKTLGEVCHRLVDVFFWQLFPDGLQDSFQLCRRPIGFGWSISYFSSMAPQTW